MYLASAQLIPALKGTVKAPYDNEANGRKLKILKFFYEIAESLISLPKVLAARTVHRLSVFCWQGGRNFQSILFPSFNLSHDYDQCVFLLSELWELLRIAFTAHTPEIRPESCVTCVLMYTQRSNAPIVILSCARVNLMACRLNDWQHWSNKGIIPYVGIDKVRLADPTDPNF